MPEPAAPPVDRKDFRQLRQQGLARSVGHAIGSGIAAARDGLARALIAVGVTPNLLTVCGFAFTLAAAAFLAVGASGGWRDGPWIGLTFAALLASAACDMLDGAVARIAKLHTRSGAVLDSSIDRLSDGVIYLGIALHFAARGNLTYVLLAGGASIAAYMISYVKARAEDLIDDCTVGFWQRGERVAAMLIAVGCGHVPALLWSQAVGPTFTVARRLIYAFAVLRRQDAGASPPVRGPLPGVLRYVALWRYPRGSVPYDLVAGANAAFLIVAPWFSRLFTPAADPLSDLLA